MSSSLGEMQINKREDDKYEVSHNAQLQVATHHQQ